MLTAEGEAVAERTRSGPDPFFVGPPGDPDAPRILLVSYHFPPDEAIGALRWQRLAGYAAERGWELDAITIPAESMPRADQSRMRDLPAGTRVYGVPVPGSLLESVQFAMWKAIRPIVRAGRSSSNGSAGTVSAESESLVGAERPSPFVRAHLARMDFRRMRAWTEQVTRAARALLVRGSHRVIVSSGPPHMAHEAARHIARDTGLPFVMDMRDPWWSTDVMPADFESPTWMRLAGRHEARCVREASLVVANTEPARRALAQNYPERADRIITVMNGADPEDLPIVERSSRFAIRFAGNLYVGRDPRTLFRALARVVRDLSLQPHDIGIDFIGGEIFDGRPVSARAEDEGIAAYFTWGAPRPRHGALAFLAGATMLVNLPQHVHAAIPAKVFEYVQFPAWLLTLSEPDSATALLFEGTEADVVHPDDEEGIARVIAQRFRQHRAGEQPRALNDGGRFSRRAQAAILLDRLERWR